ncbi:MAG: AAA family ATPase [Rhizomicrobium sp.]|jgi:hypothetical protein
MSIIRAIEGERAIVQEPRIKLIPFNEIQLGTRPRYLVGTLIPLTGLSVVWGPPKCGKSFWAFDVLMHVALGWEYRGLRVQQGAIVYCAFEGQAGMTARVEAFRQRFMTEEADDVPAYLVTVPLDLVADCAELVAAIRSQIGETTPVAVALDTLNRSLRGSESSDEDMAAYVTAADAIKDAFSCAVVVIHHCGHNDARPRGHSSLTAAADVQIKVSRDAADNIVAEVECAKDGPQGHTVTSRLEVVDLGSDDEGEPITSCVVVPADGVEIARGKKITGAAGIALNLLHKALDEAGEPAPPSPHYPQNTRTIQVSAWRRYCDAGTVSKSDEPDAKRKAFVRSCETLQQRGIIGIWSERVWIK